MNLDIFFIIAVLLTFVYILSTSREKFKFTGTKDRLCLGPYISTDLLSVPRQCSGCVSYFATPDDYVNCVKSNVRAMVKSEEIDFNDPKNRYAKEQTILACLDPYAPDGVREKDICKEVLYNK